MATRSVTVRFDGPSMVGGRVPLDQLLSVFGHLQDAVRHMVEDLAGRQPTRGPLPEAIRSAGTLELVSTHPGSFVAEVALAEPETARLVDFGGEALDRVVAGIESPQGLPQRVAVEVHAIGRALTQEIDTVEFHGGGNRVATLRYGAAIDVPLPPTRPSGRNVAHGRLLEVDWKDGTAELHTPTGIVRLLFDDTMGADLQRFARQHIAVTGSEEITPSGQRRLEIVEISSTDGDERFWRPRSVEDLVRDQGVGPFAFPIEGPSSDDAESVDDFLSGIFGPGGAQAG